MHAVRSALTWAAIVLLILVWPLLVGAVWLFDRDPVKYRAGRTFRWIGVAMTRVNPAWKVTHSGAYPADPRHPYVVVSNHQSNADIPVVSTLPWEMKWVGKRSLFRLPFAGWMMRMVGDIPVDRTDPQSRARVVRRAREVLAQRCSVMFFAEGTRSKDARVKAFHDGAFRVAIEAGVPVLPVALDGSVETLPKDDWKFGPADIRLHIFEPVPTEGLTEADVPALRDRVRAMIVGQIAAWRGVEPASVDATA
jgi:1-acyl-sn-glycerol-3-phosphate acyltransferase